jgi:hypothetical protein
MRKLIGAAALSGSPVFFLDKVKGNFDSASLEALTDLQHRKNVSVS